MKWSVHDYNENAAFVSQYGQDVVALLAPTRGENILDLGCGDGVLAEQISQIGCKVTAIDSSQDMITAARIRGLDAHVMGGETMDYHTQFDAVFSNAALHWMTQADRVIANVYRGLKTGGRFCAELGGAGNVQAIIRQIYAQLSKIGLNGDDYNPWFFPSKLDYADRLKHAGFHIVQMELFERMTPLPTDVAGWLKTFAKPFLRDVRDVAQADFINAVKDGVANELQDEQGDWFADYVRLRFLAFKKD